MFCSKTTEEARTAGFGITGNAGSTRTDLSSDCAFVPIFKADLEFGTAAYGGNSGAPRSGNCRHRDFSTRKRISKAVKPIHQNETENLGVRMHKNRVALALLALCAMPIPSNAQPVAHSAQDGIFTQAQADRGKALYLDNCMSCHGDGLQGGEDSPPLSGQPFLKKWGGLSVGALYGFVNTQMPLGQPGSLGAAGSADIVAYILYSNKIPAGQNELPADGKILSGIKILGNP